MPLSFMGWVAHLPELADPIRAERERLAAMLGEAHLLERRAALLAAEVRAGERTLLATVARHWSWVEIESAARCADIDSRVLGLATVRDEPLRIALQELDEHVTAAEALRLFAVVDVLRHDNLLYVGEAERLAALDRVLAWWTFAGKSAYERLETRLPASEVLYLKERESKT